MIDRTISTFGEGITIMQQGTGYRNDSGEWQAGLDTNINTTASIEPLGADAIQQLPAGARIDDARVFFIDGSININIGTEAAEADTITINRTHEQYRVARIEDWAAYKKIIAVKKTI